MAKILFTPFTKTQMGGVEGLGGRLLDRTYTVPATGQRKTVGFSRDEQKGERVDRDTPGEKLFAGLLASNDELYINAHGAAHCEFVANTKDPKAPEAVKVTLGDLVAQLKAFGLSTQTEAKIKLWVCESAIPNQITKKSLAQVFSEQMYAAGFHKCYIYGYVQRLGADYNGEIMRDKLPHKHVHDRKGPDDWASRYRRRYQNGIEIPENPNLERVESRKAEVTRDTYWAGLKTPVLRKSLRG